MNRIQRKTLYRKAIRKWGLPLQLGMLMEESAELIQATSKVLRKGKEDINTWRRLAEEIADVEIMIEQLKTQVDWVRLEQMIETEKHDKLLRLKLMLEESQLPIINKNSSLPEKDKEQK